MKQTHLRIAVAITLLLGGSAAIAEEVLTNAPSQTKPNASDATASKAMEAARQARAVWHNFPGFTADITIQTDAVSHVGEILVTEDFDYELSISDDAIHPWVNSKLTSVIGHRRPGGDAPEVTLNEKGTTPNFGSYVSRVDGSGVFRIEDGLIREVHRKSDSHWFEITNVEFFDAGEGKVLPETTSVTYRDPKTGNVTKNKTNRFTWTRVGDYFLPEGCLTIETGSDGSRQTREVTFTNHRLTTTEPAKKTVVSTSKLHKPLPESLTSFGAAVVGEYLYVFSGHSGDAHGFGKDLLVDHFRRIKFDDPAADWEELAMHESSQSTALVTDGEFIYRVGGLSFLNGKDENGEDQAIFHSTAHFARYDIAANTWTDLAPLPAPRSSLDAAVVGRTVYAVGGWDLQGVDGSRDAPWHDTMHAFDLDNPEAGWQELDGPGYQLRAISAGAHDNKLYVLGGISPRGFLRKTSVYDPTKNEWTEGPELVGDSQMTGFATSTFAVGGHLYSTGASGIVYRLADDESEWQVADRLLFPRMFLRLLPVGQDRLIALGGTGGMTGRTAVVETLKVDPSTNVSEKIVSWTVPYDGEAKHSQSLILDGTKLYAFGGNKNWQPHDFSEGAFSNESFQFDVANQSVTKLAAMPFPVQSGAGVVNKQTSEHKTMVVAGGMNFGESKFQSIDSILQYDAKSDEWTVADTKLPEPRAMASAVAHEDAIWVFGGSDAGGSHGLSNSVLHWWGDATNIAALPDVSLPHPRRSFGGALIDDEYFLVGGLGDGMSIEPSVDVFHMETRGWRTMASPAAPRVFPQVAVDGKKIYLFGGFSNIDGHFTECKTLEVYDSEADKWTTLADSIEGVDASMRLFNLAGRLLFFGIDRDNEQQAKFVLYDPSPMTQPAQVAAMSFSGGGGRGSSEAAKNAKMLMRKDTDKDGKLSADELGKRLSAFAEAADSDGDTLVSFNEAKAKMEADEQAEMEAKESAAPTPNESEGSEAETSETTAQQKADELQRAADAAQREADEAQRAADALRRKQ